MASSTACHVGVRMLCHVDVQCNVASVEMVVKRVVLRRMQQRQHVVKWGQREQQEGRKQQLQEQQLQPV